ncbi:hypothetical protein [Sphingomonas sp. PAMC 26617]|uniref:hypothetical protein n=1 Tax=Sphingomonas sp. PAMC 26617 TaxID=1112216 RepID=UPI000289CF15|nr:hypothetical protein [Sphingomonas sp. PAMC 26617]
MSHEASTIDRDRTLAPSGAHLRALEKLFQHPLTHNLTWRDLTHLFEAIGTTEQRPGGDLILRVGDQQLSLKPAHGKDLTARDVMDVRHLLVRAGWSDQGVAPVPPIDPATPDLLVVIDHAGARLYPIHPEHRTMAVEETHHLRHDHIDRATHDADRAENDPADTRFFAAVAASLPAKGRIVLVSQGTGQSNEARHLTEYLAQQRPSLEGRILALRTAGFSHTTVPQIVALARTALGTMPVRHIGTAA